MTRTGGLETLEFRHEFRAETDRLLRGRLLWFAVIWLAINTVFTVGIFGLMAWQSVASDADTTNPVSVLQAIQQAVVNTYGPGWRTVLLVVLTGAWYAFYGSVIWRVWRSQLSEARIVQLSVALIVADGLLGITARAAGVPFGNLFMFWFIHLVACCVFPWTVRQALIPLAIIVGLSQVSFLAVEGASLYSLFGSAFFLLAAAPAVGICWFRNSQRLQKSSHKFLREKYGMLRQELAYARQIHEAVFPDPKETGAVRYAYQYQPMRQIGGDFLFVQTVTKPNGHEIVSVVVMDVTGHGIPAALSVNRLHGEIELRFADDADIAPGEVLERLNRYVYLTMAKHSLFVTALCLRVDTERGLVEWASGGHPPAFLRGVDGTVRELGSTAFVLGACSERDFDPVEESCAFHPGDSIIAYTDGASEARDQSGRMVRISGLRSMIASGDRIESGTWPDRVVDLVTAHRGGLPSEDDTLIIELYRPLGAVTGTGGVREDEVAAGAGALSP